MTDSTIFWPIESTGCHELQRKEDSPKQKEIVHNNYVRPRIQDSGVLVRQRESEITILRTERLMDRKV